MAAPAESPRAVPSASVETTSVVDELAGMHLLGGDVPLAVVAALRDGAQQPVALKARLGGCAHSTLFDCLSELAHAGAVDRVPLGGMPNAVRYALTRSGRRLSALADALERFAAGPALAGIRHRAGTLARNLAAGWDSTILQTLVNGPLHRPAISARIHVQTFHQVTYRLQLLTTTGLVATCGTPARSRLYATTTVGQAAMALVVLAIRWQLSHPPPHRPPLSPVTLACALRIGAAGLALPAKTRGVCTLTVAGAPAGPAAGVVLEVADGRVVRSTLAPGLKPTAWAQAPADAWCHALVSGFRGEVRIGGDRRLAETVIDRLGGSLFPR